MAKKIVPKRVKESLAKYVEHRIPTGGFLKSVLENDLSEAVGRADMENMMRLRDICEYIYNEIPAGCWGSPDKVAKWLRRED